MVGADVLKVTSVRKSVAVQKSAINVKVNGVLKNRNSLYILTGTLTALNTRKTQKMPKKYPNINFFFSE